MLPVKVYVMPGGRMPERQTKGAIGYDCCARAIVSAHEMDLVNSNFRKTLFDFINVPEDPRVAGHVQILPSGDSGQEFVYRIAPGEMALVGIGFVTEFELPYFFWVAPRSGLASKYGVTVANAPGTVDPDYRGEAAVVVINNSNNPFDIRQNMRICQIIFQKAELPELDSTSYYEDLSGTERGSGGFGSTGLK